MRKAIAMWTLALCALGALGQTEIQTPSPAQSLSCLVKPEKPPRFPEHGKLDHGYGAMRVLLKFKQPDEAPEIEVLFNSAREDMQDAAYRYLRSYRLPCLSPRDGVVTAVQEFSFANTDRDATPSPPERRKDRPPFCLVMPREDMSSFSRNPRQMEHVVAVATFAGDGQQPPEVKIIHTSGATDFERRVRERLAEYRMPCRKGSEEPQSFRQQFSVIPGDQRYFKFEREVFSLREFLGMTSEPHKLQAHYDFKTMGCPFKVRYVLYGGNVPNEATVAGPPDPNRLPFLKWLAGLQMRFDAKMANDLFGSELQINVPCGSVNLDGEG